MKRNLLLLCIALISLGVLAQEQKVVITGFDYANDVFYSLENGSVTTVDRDNWDIAFIAQVMSVSVLANNGAGVELYTYPDGTIDDWATLDTLGMDWTPMYNSLESFGEGAFVRNVDPNDQLDQGWGMYNPMDPNHLISGDSLFVIKTVSGAFKKLAIIQKNPVANTWYFKYANLDGTGEKIDTIFANDYIDKYFIHYSIDSTKIQEREPGMADWDLLFTKFKDYINYPNYFPVSGVLTNDNDDHVQAQEIRESGMDQAAHNSYEESAFTSNISEIGSDWKQYTGEWNLIDTVVYYLKTYGGERDSSYYKIYFTDFSGTSEGKYTFMQERITFVSAEDHELPGLLQVYPNPATDNIQVAFDLYGRTNIDIIDMTGRIVYTTVYDASGFTNLSLDVSSLNPGVFFIRVGMEGKSNVLRFIKE